jgi:ABC-type nickel/cobalt efflux system permease component RcnA
MHDHSAHDPDEDEHARRHAATLSEYVQRGERPTSGQIMAFGAAGGMIPCPASVTVMLLALSVGQVGLGLFTVCGFSLGLALTLVGIGLLVVAGLNRLGGTHRFSWLSRHAPLISAGVVILSGLAALLLIHR